MSKKTFYYQGKELRALESTVAHSRLKVEHGSTTVQATMPLGQHHNLPPEVEYSYTHSWLELQLAHYPKKTFHIDHHPIRIDIGERVRLYSINKFSDIDTWEGEAIYYPDALEVLDESGNPKFQMIIPRKEGVLALAEEDWEYK